MRILHAVEIQDITCDLRCELEVEGVTVELQRVQHHDVVKVGYVYGMIEKIDTKDCKDKLQKVLLQVLQHKPELSLQGSKINDGNYNIDANDLKLKILSRNKPKNMAIYVETIGPQQDSVHRALKTVLPKLDKDLYGVELRLVSILTYKTDENMAARLKYVATKHSQISSNTKSHEIEGINSIDNHLPNDPSLTIRKQIMNLKTEEGERFAITITRNWNGALEIWVKRSTKSLLA